MSKRMFIITGTSRGIGEALAELLLAEGHLVHGLSRSESDKLKACDRYLHRTVDLYETWLLEEIMQSILKPVDENMLEMVCLINNAAMLEPLKPIENCSSSEIERNFKISLIAPAVLTSSFIRGTKDWKARRKVIHISSGSGSHPAPDMSIYSAAKAGLNMFTRCVGEEQKRREQNPVEIIAVNPGMVETAMQQTARGVPEEGFAMSGFFRDAHANGHLLSTGQIAGYLVGIIEKTFSQGRIADFSEGGNRHA